MGTLEGTSKHRDPTGRVTLNHLDEPFRGEAQLQFAAGGARALLTPRALADEYLRVAADDLELPQSLLTPQFAAVAAHAANEPRQESTLVFDKESQIRGNATVSYELHAHSLPVWESGVTVQIQTEPMQVIGSQSTVQKDLNVRLPPADAQFLEPLLTPAVVGKLLGAGNQTIEINHKQQFIYIYREKERIQVPLSSVTGRGESHIPFALPPVNDIVEGAAYVATAVQFTLGTTATAQSGWLAMIEARTGSVLMLRSLQGCVEARVSVGSRALGSGENGPSMGLDTSAAPRNAAPPSVAPPSAAPPSVAPPTAASPGAAPPSVAPTVAVDRKVVFFDIGDTLGRVILSAGGQLTRIEIFPTAQEVVKELSEKECRVGVISDPGGFNPDSVTSLLQDTGILGFMDRGLLVYGPKNSTDIFLEAANAAGTAPSNCIFVGESAQERAFAQAAGFTVQAVPDDVVNVIDPKAALAWVYLRDPHTKVGPTGPRPTASAAELDRHRDLVTLRGLNRVQPGQNQGLDGEYVRLVNVAQPNPTLPTPPFPGDFRFSVNGNNFGAVNAYHNCDRLFRILEDYGINVGEYFGQTQFPVRVDSRVEFGGTANTVNASAPGFVLPPSSDGFRFALAAEDTSVGMAADWRVVLHEFGHAILWAHVGSPNFRFAHSAGDAIAAILNDVGNRAARAVTFPWVDIGRSHQRSVTQLAWYGPQFQPFGFLDRAGYVAEEMLSSTLFRLYQAAGGDSTDRREQELAAAYVVYLIFKSVGLMSTVNIPATPEAYADLLMQADTGTFLHHGVAVRIGVLRKAIRWAFEMQGAYRPPAAPGAPLVNRIGSPPEVDVFINDGRDGQYVYRQSNNSPDVWNRTADDGGAVHQTPVIGQTNFAFVRVSNRGTATANNVRVQAFQSSATNDAFWPNEWEPLSDATVNAASPLASGQQIVLGPFRWIPGSLNPTLMMSVSATGDQSSLSRFTNSEPIAIRRLSSVDNNVALRRLTDLADAVV